MILRMSTLFVRTLRDDPADAEVPSHKLLVRAGYIRRAAPGIYSWLPLGWRVLRRIEQIIRDEMDAIGAQEVHFPALLPKEPYEAAAIDGANAFQMFRRLTLPMLSKVMAVAVLIRGVDLFRTFDYVYVMTSGGPGVATETLSAYAGRIFTLGNFPYAATLSLLTLIIMIIVANLFVQIFRVRF